MRLTYHHTYSSGAAMLGKDRRDTVDTILRNSFVPPGGPKEQYPINRLVAAPRQGTSLMLDEVAAAAVKAGHSCVTITFGNDTALDVASAKISTVADVASQFWGRFVFKLYDCIQGSWHSVRLCAAVLRPH
jgi:hypothetical protein